VQRLRSSGLFLTYLKEYFGCVLNPRVFFEVTIWEDIYEEIIKLKAKGECVALVTLISTSGSPPREEGAKMLIRHDGSFHGAENKNVQTIVKIMALLNNNDSPSKKTKYFGNVQKCLHLVFFGEIPDDAEPLILTNFCKFA